MGGLRTSGMAMGAPLVITVCHAIGDAPPLKAEKPIVIPGGPGGFDWMLVDGASNRVFTTHKGTKSVAIVVLKRGAALPSVTVGTAQGVAIHRADNHIFLGDDEEKKVVILDNTTLKKTGEIAVTGPVDDVIFCPKNSMIYADHDGEEVWVIDPVTNKVERSFDAASAVGPHGLAVDGRAQRLYAAGSNGKLVDTPSRLEIWSHLSDRMLRHAC